MAVTMKLPKELAVLTAKIDQDDAEFEHFVNQVIAYWKRLTAAKIPASLKRELMLGWYMPRLGLTPIVEEEPEEQSE